ncbi:hypothetical protein [Pendulispora albinea]|uniref:Uncharacterized protein n=1 Tax=Pendulispora albinea TaxID=2741071 RepID=A0ABZ2LSP8_9BACT
MASIGHIAVGCLAARLESSAAISTRTLAARMVAYSTLSLLPDLDVWAFEAGIPYEVSTATEN